MASTIGKTSLVITADSKGMNKELDKTVKESEKQKKKIEKIWFTLDLGKGLKISLSGWFGAIAAATKTLFDSFSEIAAGMDAIAKQSRALGLDTQFFSGLIHAANLSGVRMEQLGGGLRQMLNLAGQVRVGNVQAARAFQALGISIQDIRNLDGEDLFYRIADGIASIENPVERTQAAMALFGTDASQIITLLERGSAGVREMVAEAERLGIAFSAVDAARVEAANDAITRMHASFRGLQQTFVIALAPTIEGLARLITRIQSALRPALEVVAKVIETIFDVLSQAFAHMGLDELLDELAEWNPNMEEVRDFTIDALHNIAKAIGIAIDEVLKFGANWLRHVVRPILINVGRIIDSMRQLIVIGAAIPDSGFEELDATLENMGNGAVVAANQVLGMAQAIEDIPSAGQAVDTFFGTLQNGMNGAANATNNLSTALNLLNQDIANVNRELSQQIATFGLSSDMVRVWEFRQRGATDAMLEMTQALIAQREGLDLTRDMLTPQEELQRELRRVQRLLLSGAITWTTYGRAVAAAFEAAGGNEMQLPNAQAFQSSSAVETIIRARFANEQQQNNPVVRVLEQTRQLQEQQLQANQDTARQAAAMVGLLGQGFGGLQALGNQAAQQPVGLGFALGGLAALGLPGGQPLPQVQPVGPGFALGGLGSVPVPGNANQGNQQQDQTVTLLRLILQTEKDILREIQETPATVTI